MKSFDKEFLESKGKPVEFEGKELIRIDRIPVKKEFKGIVKLVSTNSKRRQGICLKVNGHLIINDVKGKSMILWEENIINAVKFEGKSTNGELRVWNAWENHHGGIDNWMNGAAMIREIDGNTRRYYCNDFDPDAQFDDIIFEITIDEDE